MATIGVWLPEEENEVLTLFVLHEVEELEDADVTETADD